MPQLKTLSRKSGARSRLVRNLATSLFLYETITTTEAKARTVLPIVERLITVARGDNELTARRRVKAALFDENAVSKIFEDLKNRLGTRTSGFVRMTKLAPRVGDGAPMAKLELMVTSLEEVVTTEKKAARKSSKNVTPSAQEEVTEQETNAN